MSLLGFKRRQKSPQKEQPTDLLREILSKYANRPLELLIVNRLIRKNIIKILDKKIHARLLGDKNFPRQVQADKYQIVKNLLVVMDKVFSSDKMAPAVRRALVNSLVQNVFLKRGAEIREFHEKSGFWPPAFLTISPTHACNLKCSGCYANSSVAFSEKLDWDVLDRIVTEETKLWRAYFTVISGGEPLLYKDKGKTILDLAKKHPDNYFLMYTNGTLIDEEMAKKLAEVGNITPAISVEGFEEETDARRGPGAYKKIIQAMKNLREAGVLFGISLTATSQNAELIISDQLMDHYFGESGALYAWIFQFMPIGRANTLALMVTPEQRVKMFRQVQHLLRDRHLFIADFWNSGCLSKGCISAGREGGYLYIEWNGNITPCVFNPYSPVNIYDVYKSGKNLNDVLKEPFFEAIRQWQKDYALDKKPEEMGNWIIPCAIKDHYEMMKELLNKYQPKPIDNAAQVALTDAEYEKGMKQYGQEVAKALDPIWEEEYLKS